MGKFQGAGEISIAKLDATTGLPTGPYRFIGCVDTFDPKFAVQLGNAHVERCSGYGQIDYQGVKEKSGTLDLVFTEWNSKNIALMLNGTVVAASSPGTVSAESFPDGMVAGDVWHLGAGTGTTRHDITTLVIKDSASPTVTLTAGTHYTVDTDFGTVKILSVAGLTQPLVASYGYTDHESVAVLNASDDSYAIRYNSKNVASSLSKGIAELYVAKFNPVGSLPMIGDDFASFSITARLFADTNRAVDATYGQFGRIVPVV